MTSYAKFHKIGGIGLAGSPALSWNVHLMYFFDFSTRRFLAHLYRKK